MVRKASKKCRRIAVSFVAALCILLIPFRVAISSTTKNNLSKVRLSWPKNYGVYIATTSKTIPIFPSNLSGFRFENGKDFWGVKFPSTGTIRVFEGKNWARIPNFPNTMNGCSNGVFMVRWKSANSDVRIASTLGYSPNFVSKKGKIGSLGYMYGTNCQQPLFKYAGTVNDNTSSLTDIYYELRFWQSAP